VAVVIGDGTLFSVSDLRRWVVTATVAVAGFTLSSCDLPASSLTSPVPAASVHGPPGGRFEVSFPTRVKEHTSLDGGQPIPQYGVGVLTTTTYSAGDGEPPTVNVSVETLTNVVPPRRARGFLRSYLPTTHGGRIVMWRKHLAAVAIVPGCNPSGHCVGDVGTFVVLVGTTLFEVWTSQSSASTADSEFTTFRLLSH